MPNFRRKLAVTVPITPIIKFIWNSLPKKSMDIYNRNQAAALHVVKIFNEAKTSVPLLYWKKILMFDFSNLKWVTISPGLPKFIPILRHSKWPGLLTN
jgi:hypothetical protein